MASVSVLLRGLNAVNLLQEYQVFGRRPPNVASLSSSVKQYLLNPTGDREAEHRPCAAGTSPRPGRPSCAAMGGLLVAECKGTLRVYSGSKRRLEA